MKLTRVKSNYSFNYYEIIIMYVLAVNIFNWVVWTNLLGWIVRLSLINEARKKLAGLEPLTIVLSTSCFLY